MAQNIENDGEVTVNRLLEFCKEQIKKGNGDKRILISDDDEGNGFHELLFGFTDDQEDIDAFWNITTVSSILEPEDVILLG